jgi:hypothetical protein
MKIEEIQELTNVINGLSPEQKEAAKSVFMKQLAHIDNLGEVNPETLDKINGGGNIIGDIYRRILGLWFD